MQYNIKGTGLHISDEIRTYVEKQLGHADKFLRSDSTALAEVEVEYTSEGGQKYRAEFTVSSEAQVYRAEATAGTLHGAIDLATDELTQELRKHKQKNLSRVRRGAARFKDFIRGFRRKI